MTDFFRFPHTPHIAWLGHGHARDDKVLASRQVRELLAHDVVVEEKVDGANLGISVDEHGSLRAQSRGCYLSLDEAKGQWKLLKGWLAPRADPLSHALFPDLMLFGEWCYAVHSVRYTKLPDWFLAFDVYDRGRGVFWSAERRNALAAKLGLSVVPRLGEGRFDVPRLKALLGRSKLAECPIEGLYVRREAGGLLVARAKLVRPEFVQSIEQHWSKRPLETNSLAGHARGENPLR